MFPCAYFPQAYFPGEYFPPICVVSVGGGGVKFRYGQADDLPRLLEQIKREDEELIAILVGAVQSGII